MERQVTRVGAGSIAALLSPSLTDATGQPMGLLTELECPDSAVAARGLFDPAIAWLRERGARRILGPMEGDTWHRCRVNVGPFETPQFPLEPWNPPWHRDLWEGYGFEPVESYSSKWVDDVGALLPGLLDARQHSREAGVTVRGIDRSRLRDELAIVHRLSSNIFADAPFYSPISLEDFLALYHGAERMIDPDLVVFALGPDGSEIGFVFAYADPARPAVHYKTIGVTKEWRRARVAAAMSHHVYSNAIAKGLRQGNHALMRDDNRSQALDAGLGRVFRRYILYEWPERT